MNCHNELWICPFMYSLTTLYLAYDCATLENISTTDNYCTLIHSSSCAIEVVDNCTLKFLSWIYEPIKRFESCQATIRTSKVRFVYPTKTFSHPLIHSSCLPTFPLTCEKLT